MMAVGEEMPVVLNQVVSSIFFKLFLSSDLSIWASGVLLGTFREESVSLQISGNFLAPYLLTWHLDSESWHKATLTNSHSDLLVMCAFFLGLSCEWGYALNFSSVTDLVGSPSSCSALLPLTLVAQSCTINQIREPRPSFWSMKSQQCCDRGI